MCAFKQYQASRACPADLEPRVGARETLNRHPCTKRMLTRNKTSGHPIVMALRHAAMLACGSAVSLQAQPSIQSLLGIVHQSSSCSGGGSSCKPAATPVCTAWPSGRYAGAAGLSPARLAASLLSSSYTISSATKAADTGSHEQGSCSTGRPRTGTTGTCSAQGVPKVRLSTCQDVQGVNQPQHSCLPCLQYLLLRPALKGPAKLAVLAAPPHPLHNICIHCSCCHARSIVWSLNR